MCSMNVHLNHRKTPAAKVRTFAYLIAPQLTGAILMNGYAHALKARLMGCVLQKQRDNAEYRVVMPSNRETCLHNSTF